MRTTRPERERDYRPDYAGGAGRRRKRAGPPAPEQAGAWLRDHPLLTGLLAALLVALLSEMPWVPRTVRVHLLQGDVVAFGTLIAALGLEQADLHLALRRGPAPWLAALLLWCVVSTALAPYRTFAVAELLRMLLCAEVFLAAAYGLRPEELRVAAGSVLVVGGAVALYGFSQYGATAQLDQITSIFGNHEQLGSFLVLLMPVALAVALARRDTPPVLIGAQIAALLLGGALLVARTRSAWAGGAGSLVALSLLALRYAPLDLNRRNKSLVVGPLLLLALAFTGFVAFGEIGPLVSKRAATLSHVLDDTSFHDRLHRWESACRMAAARPLTGWGLGSFPVLQQNWTHQGDSPARVLARGTGHQNLAHNFWAQWAAETGLVGVFLYAGTVTAFLAASLRALGALADDWRRPLLLGCVAATVGGCIDMVGAPSYTFPGVSTLFWLWVGLGSAAGREEGRPADRSLAATLIVPSLVGLAAAAVIFYVGHHG